MSFMTPERGVAVLRVRRGILGRELAPYPSDRARLVQLALVVVATIGLYYQVAIGSVFAPQISAVLDLSLSQQLTVSLVAYAAGALAAAVTGLADRWGRANLVVYGLLATAGVTFALGSVHTRQTYLVLTGTAGLVEGALLVATAALTRDFAPPPNRALALGCWAVGPAVGSLLATVSGPTSWLGGRYYGDQFRVGSAVGLGVFIIVFVGLRDLAPQLRAQVLFERRDRTLVRSQPPGTDLRPLLRARRRKLLRGDTIAPVVGMAFFLAFAATANYLLVVFFPTYGLTAGPTRELVSWYWAAQAVTLVVTGVGSDRFGVRKPFVVAGGLLSATGLALLAIQATKVDTAYGHWLALIVLIAIGGGMAFGPWLASFTETVERRAPAGVAAGLAGWGATLRAVAALALIAFLQVVPATRMPIDPIQTYVPVAGQDPALTPAENATVKAVVDDPTLVARVRAVAAQYPDEVAAAQRLTPATSAALAADPTDPAVQAEAIAEVSGLPVDDVTRVIALSSQYQSELTTLAVLDPATVDALVANPDDPAAQQAAVNEIVAGLQVSVAEAIAKLQALAAVPGADLAFLAANSPAVATAARQLQALGQMPAADLALLATYGAALNDPAVIADLDRLHETTTDVVPYLPDVPQQWQQWWWICCAGQLLLLPTVALLPGRWSPRRARLDAVARARAVWPGPASPHPYPDAESHWPHGSFRQI